MRRLTRVRGGIVHGRLPLQVIVHVLKYVAYKFPEIADLLKGTINQSWIYDHITMDEDVSESGHGGQTLGKLLRDDPFLGQEQKGLPVAVANCCRRRRRFSSSSLRRRIVSRSTTISILLDPLREISEEEVTHGLLIEEQVNRAHPEADQAQPIAAGNYPIASQGR